MRLLTVTTFLLLAYTNVEASSCFVQEASAEATKNYYDKALTYMQKNESDIEMVFSLPSVVDKHALQTITLVIVNEDNGSYELVVPVAATSSDDKLRKVPLVLTKKVFEKADLIINYGSCALQYQLELQRGEAGL